MSQATAALIQADLRQIQEQLSALSAPAPIVGATDEAGAAHGAGGFAERMMAAVHGVNQQDHDAGVKMAEVDSGASDDLVGAMLASQEASLSFSMLMQVRNKVMGAMEDLVKLPL
ncbi:flagellar hook-basal body complex protein FliE [Acidovorax sp.]|uniref:flagellar hook-basal body complex protein FliE n=1 Tax=Acidovorax sp. TaxID=1872122 RepID=UPI002ACEF2D2|nr:flagellar hook-basal body complex protein FliE [Acidovorax sp.]MDZ7862144.1 flagellar hook-basal body complex protein FliE [Acidovorax sp.]